MKRIISYISLALLTLFSFAQQNLILNGGFEEQLIMPTGFLPSNQGEQSIEFEDIITHWTVPTKGSPDVFLVKNIPNSDDAVGIPIRWEKYSGDYEKEELVYPATGDGFIGLVSGIYRDSMSKEFRQGTEAVQTNFDSILDQKRKYEMTLHYRISQKSNSYFGKIGVHFSTESMLKNFDISDDTPDLVRFGPLLTDFISVGSGDTVWTKFKATFRPNQNFQYLTIGCFNMQHHKFERDTFISTYYFIDDVSLVEIPCLVGKDTACENEQITYYSTFAGPFEWWHDDELVSTDSIYGFTADEGLYYLKTPNGEDSLYLTVLDEFIDITDISDTLCPGEVFEVTLPSKFKYRWYDGSTDYSRTFDANTNQKVIIRSEYCTDSININFDYFEWPTAYPVFVYSFCKDSTSSIDVSLPFYSKNFYWSDGQQGFTRSFYQSGNYGYEIIDSNGCSNSGLVTIREQCPSKYFIPNAFAPDGVNKVFRPYLSDVLEAEMIIYNRWGEKIYSEQSSNPSWDGIYQGEPCSVGVYFYILEIIRTDNKKEQLKGNIHLLR
jgi:gliding motility-associated-like protein